MPQTQIVESHISAWRDRDSETIARHVAPDGVRSFEIVVLPLLDESGRRVGPAQVVIPVRGLLPAIPDLTHDILDRADVGSGAQVEMVEWRHTGPRAGDWDRLTGQGEHVEFTGVSVFRVGEGEILEERLYSDPYLLTRSWFRASRRSGGWE